MAEDVVNTELVVPVEPDAVIPAPPPPVEVPAVRDPATGHFLANNPGGGRPKSSLNRVTRAMRDELARVLEETGERGNPLCTLHRLMLESKDERIILKSASELLAFLIPKRHAVELEQPDGDYEQQTIQITEQIRRYFTIRTTKEG